MTTPPAAGSRTAPGSRPTPGSGTPSESGATLDSGAAPGPAEILPAEIVPVPLAVDLVVLTVRDDTLCVLLVRRGIEPFAGRWALPGGFVRPDEDLDAAAVRELREETGLARSTGHLEQLATYADLDRDPRGRVATVAYLALAPDLPVPVAGTDAAASRWWAVTDILRAGSDGDSGANGTDGGTGEGAGSADGGAGGDGRAVGGMTGLAFDHARILADGVERARSKIEYSPVATAFCPPEFTVAQLRRIYEIVWGTRLDPRNFHRKVTRTAGFLVPTGRTTTRDGGRPAELFTRGDARLLHPAMLRPEPGDR
ncbi:MULTISPECIES: NUDIX domain-containing protein [unclassified Parafrankia]|uniref:NUDIX hydrolase n=1 Tax=unclassified Parafrankia TaxID=2994368 RepID=UPI000DA5033B|nr:MULTISPECIES: NUDIX hydrolase [unclassified Parafrankia]SQD96504.1 NUDIX hydrolase [Parafrankia sp. Ea1.12]